MSDLIFYTNPQSRGRIVRWMLEEVGADYETVVIDYASGMKSDAYRAINPMGKVPAIVHRSRTVTECAAICAYLADAFPDAGLAPATEDRADYYRWLFFAAGPLEAAATERARGIVVTPEQSRMVGYGSFDTVIDALEHAVSGRTYIAGDRFTAADVYVGSHIMWGSQFGWLPKRPAFDAYMARLAERPAYIRGGEKDDALMAEVKA
ncbi:glutathione S-transferase family protein [uncultured Sphingomonas sp.]|uniref:glutathione S-transferase family protein n=1 Tax=uncultured Sphingomonas sp. TaxID=158754 RepID=UPI0025FA442C|nr:glutathione S-transferase family protein [uncultured Sphingomonas sp.]